MLQAYLDHKAELPGSFPESSEEQWLIPSIYHNLSSRPSPLSLTLSFLHAAPLPRLRWFRLLFTHIESYTIEYPSLDLLPSHIPLLSVLFRDSLELDFLLHRILTFILPALPLSHSQLCDLLTAIDFTLEPPELLTESVLEFSPALTQCSGISLSLTLRFMSNTDSSRMIDYAMGDFFECLSTHDEIMVEVFHRILSIHSGTTMSNKVWYRLMCAFCYDIHVMVDLLVSKETRFLEVLLLYIKLLHRSSDRISSSDSQKLAMVVKGLITNIEAYHEFPYSPRVLLARLRVLLKMLGEYQ